MNTDKAYWKYWGKARKKGEEGTPYHLLPYHCLDVAAVGAVYLLHHPALRADWASRLQITETSLCYWFVFFLSQHDLGKLSYRFQGLRRDICYEMGNQQEEGRYHPRHDTLGYLLWEEKIGPLAIEQAWFGPAADRVNQRDWRRNLAIWARTATGHHGQPPKISEQYCLDHLFSQCDQQAAMQFSMDCADLLLPDRGIALPDGRAVHERLKPLSWWLAGLAVLCDWLGSNRTFFDYQTKPDDADKPLECYWEEEAKLRAEKALRHYGLLPPKAEPQTLGSLFGFTSPTPLQQTAANLPLPAAPQLFILEDVTGAGKTEAALMLAHRLIQSGQADGFYFGLPTMATSNAMFRRIVDKGLAQKFFQGEPNWVLAHSASRLEPVMETLLSGGNGEGDYEGREEPSAANERLAWFSDNRKKALLADVGVGTVDQALLAVLYSRHQSLRLLGLARKVLIVDEVHAADAYMLKLLEVLLTFHAASGGSAILLSATLPRITREKLARAYRIGLGFEALALPNKKYPLLTRISQDEPDEISLETRPEVARTVDIAWVHSVEAAVEVLLAARAKSRCACWIRNTVDDAIAAFELLKQKEVPTDDLMVFHARFALGDRLKIEDRVLRAFGPESQEQDRAGKVLVGTQVLEQSLDLDMDVMLSDLAPVDLLIQRAGRLCRHVRDAAGNPSEENGRGPPKLWLFAPVFTETPATDWLGDPMPGTAAVYPDHGRLWLTAKLLLESGKFTMPGDARKLIEGVYGLEAEASIPAAFQNKTNKVEGEKSAKQSVAAANTLTLERGYEDQGFDPWDDALIPTRLEDQPSVTVRLARWEASEVKPWIAAPKFAWELSQLSVRVSLLTGELESEDQAMKKTIDHCREQMSDKGKWSKLLVLSSADGLAWGGQARNKKGEVVSLVYDERMGLRRA
ncbi:MAG: CRISPR-associated helicase Cas3' [Methylococcaceae bacterium]|nr:CRISPR-associated helicase Cas3' [Methylococcaceae bacterium]